MRWLEVVKVVAVVELVVAVAAVVGRAGWVVPRLLGRAAIASAPVVGIGSRTWRACLATRKGVLSAARR